MELCDIIDMLQDFQPQPIIETRETVHIHTHKMIKPGQKSFFPACLYVGYASELSPVPEMNTISNLICIDDAPITEKYRRQKNMNLYVMHGKTNQFDVLNRIADIMIDEAKLTANMRYLLDALYENKGLQYLVNVASEVFENPIFINDTAYKILAMTKNTTFEDSTLEEEKELGYIHEINVSALKQSKIFEKAEKSEKTISSKRLGRKEEWLFRSVRIQNITVANIGIINQNRPFQDLDYNLLDRFSKLVAIELQKNDFYNDNKGVMINFFLADLLSGKMQNEKVVEQRSHFLNLSLKNWLQVMVVIDHENSKFENRVQQIGTQINQFIPDCQWTVYRKNVVILLSRNTPKLLSPMERENIETFLLNNRLSIGISNPFSELLETSQYYKQAIHAVEAGIYVSRSNGVFHYDDQIIYYIPQILSKHKDLNEFCPLSIHIIQNYDEKHSTQLLDTLDKYLHYVGDPVSASKALHIHRNTLLYRINKIKELTHIDLENGDERLKIQLYLKFLEYQKGSWDH